MIREHVFPPDDIRPHTFSMDCPCKPVEVEYQGIPVIHHPSFDHREIWMNIETMLGFRCFDHQKYVDRNIGDHAHIDQPEKFYEYHPHPK